MASGYSDWADSEMSDDRVRRIGIVHAAANATGATLFAASWMRRRNGGGRLLALAGSGVMSAAAYLGGHLSFAEGVGVDQTAFEPAPEDWMPVLGSATSPRETSAA